MPCEVVVIGTPIDLNRIITIEKPTVRVTYELQEIGQPDLPHLLEGIVKQARDQQQKAPAASR